VKKAEETRDSGTGPTAEAEGEGKQSRKRKSRREQELEILKAQLEEKTKKTEENYDRFLRAQAELENYKKRVAREKSSLLKYVNE